MGKETLKERAQSAANELLANMQSNGEAVHLAAELLLQQMALEPDEKCYGVHIEPSSAVVLRMAGIDASDRPTIDRHVGRIRMENQLREVYLGDEALKAAQVAVAEARRVEDEQRGAIEEQLRELKARLDGLETARIEAQAKVGRMMTARDQLAERCVPAFIEARAVNARHRVRTGAAQKALLALETRRKELEERERRVSDRSQWDNVAGAEPPLSLNELKEKAELGARVEQAKREQLAEMRDANIDVDLWLEQGLNLLSD